MEGFKIITPVGLGIRFQYYLGEVANTSQAFSSILPFERVFLQARISGKEIWIDNAPPLDIVL